MASFITSLPSWALFLLVFASGILAAEAGAWMMRRNERKQPKEKQGPLGSLMGALLGLLAFMLGLTFSITSSRFSERKHLVVNQAKAIGTCFLRTSLLPEKQKLETQRLFKEYIDVLIGTPKSSEFDKSISRLEMLELQIWQQAASLKDEKMDGPLRSLYIASVNEVIDISGERKTVVFIFNIPSAVWTVLLLLFVFSMFVAGLEISSFRIRRNINVPIMTAAFAIIVVLISAMDASTKPGHFTVSQQPLIDVQQMIKEDIQRPVEATN